MPVLSPDCFTIALLCLIAAPVMASAQTSPTPGQQVAQSLKTSDGESIEYLLYLPEGDQAGEADAEQERWPLMLFLHGRGESHGPLDLVAKWGPPMMAKRGDKLPFILVSPQCPGEDNWRSETQQKRLVELLDSIVETYDVDEDRVTLSGLSMGGYGSWRLAADHPERFCAVVPICGGGDPKDAAELAKLPIWVFHGDQDSAVPFDRSVEMVEAIRAAGGEKIRFTTLEHIGHNCWSAAYATPELYSWIKDQKR